MIDMTLYKTRDNLKIVALYVYFSETSGDCLHIYLSSGSHVCISVRECMSLLSEIGT